jgi:uncharacterized damage-inducible protein DinB
MKSTELFILNFEEVRRRSVKLWSTITPDLYFWKPDENAMCCIEMLLHVLEGEHLFHKIVENRSNLGNYISPWESLPYTSVEEELAFAKPYRELFLAYIKSFTNEDFDSIEIIRAEKNQRRSLGDYLLRIAYHEAVHTGQMLDYLRTAGIERPLIWD